MPGSHDSGMSVLTHGTALVTEENTLTHWIDVAGQLNAGFRYFDIRPVISAGEFVTGHYSEILGQWIGGNGQSLDAVIQQVNAFTAQNKEMVILDVSHSLNTDDGFRLLNDMELGRLISQLEGLKDRYTGQEADLSIVPLKMFIAENAAVIVIWRDPTPILPPTTPLGIFPGIAMPIYNEFSDTDNSRKMKQDQLSKLADKRKNNGDGMFLVSWTLTTLINIREVARQAHELLFEPGEDGFWSTAFRKRATSYPNIILIDGIGDKNSGALQNRNIAALSMAINHVALQDVPCPG